MSSRTCNRITTCRPVPAHERLRVFRPAATRELPAVQRHEHIRLHGQLEHRRARRARADRSHLGEPRAQEPARPPDRRRDVRLDHDPGDLHVRSDLSAAGIPYKIDLIAGGHEWYTWRQLFLRLSDHDGLQADDDRGHHDHRRQGQRHRTGDRVGGHRRTCAGDRHRAVLRSTANRPGTRSRSSSGFATAKLGPLAAGSTVTATYSGDSLYR